MHEIWGMVALRIGLALITGVEIEIWVQYMRGYTWRFQGAKT